MLTVKQLIEKLQELPEDLIMVTPDVEGGFMDVDDIKIHDVYKTRWGYSFDEDGETIQVGKLW